MFPYVSDLHAAVYGDIVELIYHNDIPNDQTSLQSTKLGFSFCLGRMVCQSASQPEIAIYGGLSHDLKAVCFPSQISSL